MKMIKIKEQMLPLIANKKLTFSDFEQGPTSLTRSPMRTDPHVQFGKSMHAAASSTSILNRVSTPLIPLG